MAKRKEWWPSEREAVKQRPRAGTWAGILVLNSQKQEVGGWLGEAGGTANRLRWGPWVHPAPGQLRLPSLLPR